MDCFITIEGAVAFRDVDADALQSLKIYGTAFACNVVEVEVGIAGGVFFATADVADVGGWVAEVDVSVAQVDCAGAVAGVDVTARCSEAPSCAASTKFTQLQCQVQRGCPVFAEFAATAVDDLNGGCAPGSAGRHVALRAGLSELPPSGQPPYVQFYVRSLDGGAQILLDALVAVPGQLLLSETLLTGGVYVFGLKVVAPTPCPGPVGVLQVSPCPEVPGQGVCPGIVFGIPEVSDKCTWDGRRIVSADATVQPGAGYPVTATLRLQQGDTQIATLDSRDAEQGGFTLSGEAQVVPGPYTVVVDVGAPESCGSSGVALDVPLCLVEVPPADGEVPDQPGDSDDGGNGGGTPGGGSGGNGGRFAIPWCAIAMIFGLVVAVFGALLLGAGFCLIGFFTNPYVVGVFAVMINVGLVLLMVGTLLLVLWMVLCASCPNNCTLLEYLIIALSSIIVVVALLSMIGFLLTPVSPLCAVGWVIDTMDFGLLLSLAIYWQYVSGCRPWPQGWPNWARIAVPGPLTFICRRTS